MHVFSGLRLVPPALVGGARALLASQGVDANALNANGEIEPMALVGAVFDTLEIRTAYSEPVVIDLHQPQGPPDTATAELLQRVQPAIIFNGRYGSATIAPFGVPSGFAPGTVQKWGIGIGIGAAALGLLFFAYAYSKR